MLQENKSKWQQQPNVLWLSRKWRKWRWRQAPGTDLPEAFLGLHLLGTGLYWHLLSELRRFRPWGPGLPVLHPLSSFHPSPSSTVSTLKGEPTSNASVVPSALNSVFPWEAMKNTFWTRGKMLYDWIFNDYISSRIRKENETFPEKKLNRKLERTLGSGRSGDELWPHSVAAVIHISSINVTFLTKKPGWW